MSTTPGWETVTIDGQPQLEKKFRSKNFATAMQLANAIATAADEADHHPQLVVQWGSLTVRWWSHDAGGISDRDHALAARTDQLAQQL